MAKDFEKRGADYVAFGSFFTSPTKPNSNIIALEVLKDAKTRLTIPVCAIGGINTKNLDNIIQYKPDMISIINDIWTARDIRSQSSLYSSQF